MSEFRLNRLAKHKKRRKTRSYRNERDKYKIDNRVYTNMNKLTVDYHTNSYFVRSRMENGMSVEQAAKTPINKNREVFDHEGNLFETIEKMCDFYNISIATFRNRRNVYGWTLKAALTTPPQKTGRPRKRKVA